MCVSILVAREWSASGGMSPGAPKGNKNALKHGLYTAEAIARHRQISGLMRAMKSSVRNH